MASAERVFRWIQSLSPTAYESCIVVTFAHMLRATDEFRRMLVGRSQTSVTNSVVGNLQERDSTFGIELCCMEWSSKYDDETEYILPSAVSEQ